MPRILLQLLEVCPTYLSIAPSTSTKSVDRLTSMRKQHQFILINYQLQLLEINPPTASLSLPSVKFPSGLSAFNSNNEMWCKPSRPQRFERENYPPAVNSVFGVWHLKKYVHVQVVHPLKLTWNLKLIVSKRNLLFQGLIFRFHVKLWGFISIMRYNVSLHLHTHTLVQQPISSYSSCSKDFSW